MPENSIQFALGGDGGKPRVFGLAYGGGRITLGNWQYPIVVDLAGLALRSDRRVSALSGPPRDHGSRPRQRLPAGTTGAGQDAGARPGLARRRLGRSDGRSDDAVRPRCKASDTAERTVGLIEQPERIRGKQKPGFR